MIDFSWHIEDEGRDPDVAGRPRPILGTWHFLRKALRRAWATWVGLSMLGAMLGVAALILQPPASSGTATLLLAHPSGTDSESAMATDVSLLNTRAVATTVIDELGLTMSPEAFQSTVTAEQLTTQVLKITVKAPDDAAAVKRTATLVNEYLAFRSSQMKSLTDGLIAGYQTRIAALQQQVNTLTKQYNQFSEQGAAGQAQAADALSQRAELNSQITTMQRAIEEASLQTSAAISSTHVIDVPRAVPRSTKKAVALNVGSGVIAGAALGAGLVVFRALTSERLRRRREIALALGVPVSFSVRSTGPPLGRLATLRGRLWARLPRRGFAGKDVGQPWQGRDLQAVVYGLESAIVPRTGWAPKVTATSSRGATSTRRSKSTAAARSSRRGTSVAVEDRPDDGRVTPEPAKGNRRSGGSSQGREGAEPPSSAQAQNSLARERSTSGGGDTTTAAHSPGRVALAAVGNAEAGADILRSLAAHLRRLGLSLFLVDLSTSGVLHATAVPAVPGDQRSDTGTGNDRTPSVFRPQGLPGLSRGPLGTASGAISELPDRDPLRTAWDAADVVLALLDVDPGLEVENLRTWVDQVVPLVTAGRSSAELLGTTAELIRSTGLRLPFAIMLGADTTDESLGLPEPEDVAAGSAARSGQR